MRFVSHNLHHTYTSNHHGRGFQLRPPSVLYEWVMALLARTTARLYQQVILFQEKLNIAEGVS